MTGACRTAANPAPASARARASVLAALVVLLLVRLPVPVSAQTIEVSPFGGYRFGGDLFEAVDEPAARSRRRAGRWRRRGHRDAGRPLVRDTVHPSAGPRGHSRRCAQSARPRACGRGSLAGRRPPGVRCGACAPLYHGSLGLTYYGAGATTRSGSRLAPAVASSCVSIADSRFGSTAECSRPSWTSTRTLWRAVSRPVSSGST